MAYSYQGTLSVSDDGSSGLSGELNYGVQSLSPVATSDYNTLTNKPRINNVELVGNITTERLGIRNGEDGFSPVITERETETGYDITITDVEGSNTITLKNGTNGLNGTNGQDGKSAYEIAVDNGFVGTEQEWLESLKGQDGQDGIVMDAPSDGKVYGRMNANWVETTATVDNILSTTSENPVQNKVITGELNKKIDSSIKGVANGVAELDSNGKVLTAQLPSYVDDVLEYSGISDFPAEGETGKIYVDTTTNKTYRWSGSTYIEISESIALGETSSTAYRGDRGKIAYDHSQSPHAPADAEANVQSDWNETDTTSDAYILNKPASLPANGGNADTLDGLHASDFSQIINFGHTSTDTKSAIGIPYKTTTYWCYNWTDYPVELYDGQGMMLVAHYNSYGTTVGVDSIWCRQIFISPHPNTKIYQRILSDTNIGEWTGISDGGNADTLDGLHESSFAQNIGVWSEGNIKDLTLSCTKSGFVFIHPGVTGMPSDNIYWFGLIDCNTTHRQLIARNVTNNAAYSIIWNNGVQKWTVWNNLADGGNAATLESHPASDFVLKTDYDALAARVAALEGK